MELSGRVKRALDGLASQDLAFRINAVEELAECSSDIAGRVASLFEADEEARFLVFERLGRFGSPMVKHVERMYRESEDSDLRLTAASALLYLGSNVGVPALMAAVEAGNPNLCMAAISLSSAGVSEAASPIEDVLLECDLSDAQTLECLTAALRRLKHQVREDVRHRLSQVEPTWLGNSLLG
jgi:HEAT repeat protein